MFDSMKIHRLSALLFVLLIVDHMSDAQTQIDSDHQPRADSSWERIIGTALNSSAPSIQKWPAPVSQDSQRISSDESTPVLDNVLNRILERIRPSSEGQEGRVNDSRHPPKRDLENQSKTGTEIDALVHDDHNNGPDRHIQYDTMQLTSHASASDAELADDGHQQLSRYTMSTENPVAESSSPGAVRLAQAIQSSQERNSAVQGRAITSLSKLSHHSKPPYAAGDQYDDDRSGPSFARIPNEVPLMIPRKGATTVIAEVIPLSHQNSTEMVTGQEHPSNHNDTNQEAIAALANSLKRITTNLVDDDQKGASLISSRPLLIENLLEKQEFQNLAPANSPVELNPIPLDESSAVNQLSAGKEPLNEWDTLRMYSFFPGGPVSSGSHYSGDPAIPVNASQTRMASSLLGSKLSNMAEPQSPADTDHSNIAHSRPNSNLMTKKTFEALSNQLKHHGNDPMWESKSSLNDAATVDNRNADNIVHRTRPPTHYLASLTNVTAPLVPPHSATEAMETSLGSQAGREILNQVSGLLRQANHSLHHERAAQAIQARHPMSEKTNSQSVYLPPANSLVAYRPSNEGLSASMEPKITGAPTNNSTDRRLDNLSHQRRPSWSSQQLPSQPASGFRSPVGTGVGVQHASSGGHNWHSPHLTSYLNLPLTVAGGQDNAPMAASESISSNSLALPPAPQNVSSSTSTPSSTTFSSVAVPTVASLSSTTNGFITNAAAMSGEHTQTQQISSATSAGSSSGATTPATSTSGTFASVNSVTTLGPGAPEMIGSNASQTAGGLNRRLFNLTRVEHITAECSNDLIRTVIVFNGTFRGMIYSSGYVRDSSCIYVNGTGKTRYDFSIRLNQCGTLARQELHPAGRDNDLRRRDQVMWNTLSIQYNPIIEQEWDEHFRVSCEYGSDFWKTVSFNPFNVETNTGSPVVFTVDPPQCQMEILRGHGMVGPRQETISGPVTVGDPLTLLIHMKSERAGYDILVKNCIAHDNAKQRMQLIDSNGCVVNERFISPFRGTYNDNDLKHVTLYAYLKAFRFTGSPILYLECEIHMCQSSCPPQMCYWRRLSKRSASSSNGTHTMQYLAGEDESSGDDIKLSNETNGDDRKLSRRGRKMGSGQQDEKRPSLSDKMSLTQSLLVRPLDDTDAAAYSMQQLSPDQSDKSLTSGQLLCYRRAEVLAFLLAACSLLLVAMSVTIACCWQQTRKLKQLRRSNLNEVTHRGLCGTSSSLTSLTSANSINSSSATYIPSLNHSLAARSIRRPFGSTSIGQPPVGRHKGRLLFPSFLHTFLI